MRNSSYSFMPILLKLYRCFCHDLKICMWFGYYPEIIFCHFFCNLNLVIFKCFYYQSEKIVGTLCAQLHSCFGHGLKICMWFGYNPQITFYLLLQVELNHFPGIIYNKVNGQGIPCGRSSSYSFIPILSKLHWCFGHGLTICMWFRYNPQIIFCCFFAS